MDVEERDTLQSRSNSAKSESTTVTTPDQSIGEDNDIWASDNDHDHGHWEGSDHRPSSQDLLSDLPTIRRQHMTDGYREGLSVGKAKVMQKGFDAGYPIGIQIALRAGKILGIIEGVIASKGVTGDDKDVVQTKKEVEKLYARAKDELAITALLKETDDQVINEAEGVPASIEVVLQKWESAVLTSFAPGSSQK